MNKGPQPQELKLTVQENNQLIEWTRRHKTSQALALRARKCEPLHWGMLHCD